MTNASDIVWDYLEEEGIGTRGETEESFAEVLLALIADPQCSGNGLTCDALEAALNTIAQSPDQLQYIQDYLNGDLEDEDD
jgi:hypothetical protein